MKTRPRPRVAGFWLEDEGRTLAYQVQGPDGDRVTMTVQWPTLEAAQAGYAKAIEAIGQAAASEHLITAAQAKWLLRRTTTRAISLALAPFSGRRR